MCIRDRDGAFAVKFVKGEVKAGTENPKLKEEAYSLRVTHGGAVHHVGGAGGKQHVFQGF